MGRAGPQLHQQDGPGPAAEQGGICPGPRGGHEGAGDRSGVRTGPRQSRVYRDVRRQRPRRRGAEFKRALALNPTDLSVLANSAALLQSLGRLDEALALEEAVVRRDPVNVTALFNLGVHQRMAGRLDAAIASSRTVLSLSPSNGGAHCQLGVALLLKGDAEGALAEIEQEASESYKM